MSEKFVLLLDRIFELSDFIIHTLEESVQYFSL